MSGGARVEVEWCWAQAERVVTWGSGELALYQVEDVRPEDSLRPSWLRLASTRAAHLLACTSELSYICAVAVNPRHAEDVLLAVGQANGHVALTTLQHQPASGAHRPFAPYELVPKHGRQVQALSWNPSESGLLGVALDKYRADYGALVWDVALHGSAAPSEARGSVSSSKPLAELALSESVHSLAWLPRHSRTLVLGANHKHLKIYDLREGGSKAQSSTPTKAVWGLALDPLAPHRLASFWESTVALWDLRNMEKAAFFVAQPFPVAKLGWCPTRAGLLGLVLGIGAGQGAGQGGQGSGQGSVPGLRLLDVQQGLWGGGGGASGGAGGSGGGGPGSGGATLEEVEPAVLERWLPLAGGGGGAPVVSFAWHPFRQNCLLAAQLGGTLSELTVSERIALSVAPSSLLLCSGPSPSLLLACTPGASLAAMDQAQLMCQRALVGYGLQAEVRRNGELAQEASLQRLWHWLHRCRSRTALKSTTAGEERLCRFPGVKSVLKLEAGGGSGAVSSDAVQVPWVGVEGGGSRTVFRSEDRGRALQLCGWGIDWRLWEGSAEEEGEAVVAAEGGSEQEEASGAAASSVTSGASARGTGAGGWLADTLLRLEEERHFTRAAAIATFHLQLRRAIQCVQRGSVEMGHSHLAVLAMSLAGFSEERSSLWQEMCQRTGTQLQDPYLRAVFAFLTAESDNYDKVLNEDGMTVADRVAFACLYLSDVRLAEFVSHLSGRLKEEGHLDGLLLTGLGREGVSLLQQYVDVSGDVQSASALVLQAQALAWLFPQEPRLQMWTEAYRLLLDAWQLWNQRAHYDVALQAALAAGAVAAGAVTPSAAGRGAAGTNSPLFLTPSSSSAALGGVAGAAGLVGAPGGAPHPSPPQQVFVSCNFCGKSISALVQGMGRRGGVGLGSSLARLASSSSAQRLKMSSCPNCRKPLPRCYICLMHMGTASGAGPPVGGAAGAGRAAFSSWFTWCQTCHHGGHADHIASWFREHAECPVTGCSCRCLTIDAASRYASASCLQPCASSASSVAPPPALVHAARP